MGDIFNEHMVRKLPDGRDTLIKVGSGVAAIAIMTLGLMYAGVMSLLIIIGVGVGIYFLWDMLNVEYEYILTNDELDIDKIIARKRRRHMLTANVKEFELFAPANEEYKSELSRPVEKEYDFSTHKRSTKRWLAIYSADGKRCRLIFEPNRKMRDGIRQQNPRVCKPEPVKAEAGEK